MLKLLIADPSEPFTDALKAVFQDEFQLQICHDGESALEQLLSFAPDALILNFMLPYKDGLTVLQESAHKPRVILAITPYMNAYIEQTAANLGVHYIMIMPAVSALRVRLMDMLAAGAAPKGDLAAQLAVHLHALHFHTHLDGYRQLSVGIPVFARNPNMLLSKELYPAIADYFGCKDARTVEHSIRKSIADAWAHRDPAVWESYFPTASSPPTNKEFISRLAEKLVL